MGLTQGGLTPHSEYSAATLTPLLSAGPAGAAVLRGVALHEQMLGVLYTVVATNDYAAIPGWPQLFAAQVHPADPFTVPDAAARCLTNQVLGFETTATPGATETDSPPCPPDLATWLTSAVSDALALVTPTLPGPRGGTYRSNLPAAAEVRRLVVYVTSPGGAQVALTGTGQTVWVDQGVEVPSASFAVPAGGPIELTVTGRGTVTFWWTELSSVPPPKRGEMPGLA